jgi:hypothetical protein
MGGKSHSGESRRIFQNLIADLGIGSGVDTSLKLKAKDHPGVLLMFSFGLPDILLVLLCHKFLRCERAGIVL